MDSSPDSFDSSYLGLEEECELRCDKLAASYTGGSELIAALRIQESLAKPNYRRGLIHRIMNELFPYPTLSERIEAINKFMQEENAQSLGRA